MVCVVNKTYIPWYVCHFGTGTELRDYGSGGNQKLSICPVHLKQTYTRQYKHNEFCLNFLLLPWFLLLRVYRSWLLKGKSGCFFYPPYKRTGKVSSGKIDNFHYSFCPAARNIIDYPNHFFKNLINFLLFF